MEKPRIRHIAINVEDLDKTAEYYKRVFGMRAGPKRRRRFKRRKTRWRSTRCIGKVLLWRRKRFHCDRSLNVLFS